MSTYRVGRHSIFVGKELMMLVFMKSIRVEFLCHNLAALVIFLVSCVSDCLELKTIS